MVYSTLPQNCFGTSHRRQQRPAAGRGFAGWGCRACATRQSAGITLRSDGTYKNVPHFRRYCPFADNLYDMCPEATSAVAYVIDWGVRADHEQFQTGGTSRVVMSRDFTTGAVNGVTDTTNACTQPYTANLNAWHGTAVASVLAGNTVGASHAQIVSLRVWRCDGASQSDWIVNAVRWIHSANDPYRYSPGLVNYSGAVGSWYATYFQNLNSAVDTLVRTQNVPFFTSAENYSGDSCQFSPNSLAYTNVNHSGTVFVVGGTSLGAGADTYKDYRWQEWDGALARIGPNSGSNGGACVSVYAPACAIYAASRETTTAYTPTNPRPSGTSFASPLAAGVAARYIERYGYGAAHDVYDYLLWAAGTTGTPIYNVTTPEYWMCFGSTGVYTSRTPLSVCPPYYYGQYQPYGSTPIHYPALGNTSGANILYTGTLLSCP